MKISEIAHNFQEIEKQKEQAKSILADISKHFKFALIAGGAPRNWSYNRKANDLDFYVCREVVYGQEQKSIDNAIAKSVKELSGAFGFGENKAASVVNSNVYGGFILNSLYDFQVATEAYEDSSMQNCQFIIIDDTSGDVKDLESFSNRIFSTYDFGICMTSMDKDGNFYNDPLFETDRTNKTFTVNIRELRRNNNSGMKKLVERFEKMETYFPDHKMRICA